MNRKQIASSFLLAGSLLLTGCSESTGTNPLSKQDPIIGVWRGETGGDKANNCVMELTISRIDAGLICIGKSWPKDPTQGIASEIHFPLRQKSSGIWDGEYHGQDGFGYSDLTTEFALVGHELHEHRMTVTDHDKKWNERWTYHRYSP